MPDVLDLLDLLGTRDNGLTFQDAVFACFADPELMREYRRLTGSSFGLDTRTGLDLAIDSACGVEALGAAESAAFFEFVRDCVWLRLPCDPVAALTCSLCPLPVQEHRHYVNPAALLRHVRDSHPRVTAVPTVSGDSPSTSENQRA